MSIKNKKAVRKCLRPQTQMSDGRVVSKLMKLFQETPFFSDSTLVANNIRLSNPENIFSEAKQDGHYVLIPAYNAIGIVLRHNVVRQPTLNQLEEWLKIKVAN